MYECYCAGFVDINGHAYMPYPCLARTAAAEEKQVARPNLADGHPNALVYCADDEGLSNMSKLRNI